jgi:hypothetical protein
VVRGAKKSALEQRNGSTPSAILTANGTRGRGGICADRKLIGQKVFHATIIHYQQYHVGFRRADLKPYTSAFNANRGWSGPASATAAAARRESPAKLRAEDESGLFHARYDNDAFGLI